MHADEEFATKVSVKEVQQFERPLTLGKEVSQASSASITYVHE